HPRLLPSFPTRRSSDLHVIIAALDRALGSGKEGVRFHPGVEYRHLCVVPRAWEDAECVPPHDLTGETAVLPTGSAASKLNALMEDRKSTRLNSSHVKIS